jgi:hypothetical protein
LASNEPFAELSTAGWSARLGHTRQEAAFFSSWRKLWFAGFRFITGFLLVVFFIIDGSANDKKAYDKKDAGNQSEEDVHGRKF